MDELLLAVILIVLAGSVFTGGYGVGSDHARKKLSIESSCARYNPTTGAYEVTKKCPWEQK